MGHQTAEHYFRTLSELMLATQVTDRHGSALYLNDGTEQAVRMVLEVGRVSGKVMLVGNGGSEAIVSHVQNDIAKAVGIRAMVFTQPPLLTAQANDDGYGSVFERPVELWAEPRDILLTVSSSGSSENILRSVRVASGKGCRVITFSGFSPDNPLRGMGDLNFYVGSHVYGYVETAHAALTHFITDRARTVIESESRAEIGI